MIEIKKIKKISLANLLAWLYSVFGFLASFGFFIFLLANSLSRGETASPLFKFILFNLGLAFLAGVFTAFFAGLAGWLLGFFAAGLYNIFAKKAGGLKVELSGEAIDGQGSDQKRLFPF